MREAILRSYDAFLGREKLCATTPGLNVRKAFQAGYEAAAAELQKRIGELGAERDEARSRNARVELEAVGYSNRMHEAIARAEAAEQALAAERQQRKELEKRLEEINEDARDRDLRT